MKYSVLDPCMFAPGVVYRAQTPSYVLDKSEYIWLVLGPSTNRYSDPYPTGYRYLNLLTGFVGDFHRNSYFAVTAEPL